MRPRAFDGLLRLALDTADEDHRSRAAAISAVAALRPSSAIEPLFDMRDHLVRPQPPPEEARYYSELLGDGALRAHVVVTLGRLGDERVRDELIEYAQLKFGPRPYGMPVSFDGRYDDIRTIARPSNERLLRLS